MRVKEREKGLFKSPNTKFQTWYEYLQSLPPSKLGIFLRRKLAHNQGCPPVNLMHVYTVCDTMASCDDCWWMWLNSERIPPADDEVIMAEVTRCWDCRWGAKGDVGHPYVVCMNRRFYGVTMAPEDFCSDGTPRYKSVNELTEEEAETARKLSVITEDNESEYAAAIRKRYELRRLKREMNRRKREAAEGGNNETACECKEDQCDQPDPREGSDRSGDD